jgi:hypothetical protein
LFLNAAILLLPYIDPANPGIITQLSKLMRHSAVCKRPPLCALPRPSRWIVMPMLRWRVAGIALVAGTSASDAGVTLIGA